MATWSMFLAVMIGTSRTMSWMGVKIGIFDAIIWKMTMTSFGERDRFIPVPYDWIFQGSLVIIPLDGRKKLTSFLNITRLPYISVSTWLPFTNSPLFFGRASRLLLSDTLLFFKCRERRNGSS
jgi:hypothetical protein